MVYSPADPAGFVVGLRLCRPFLDGTVLCWLTSYITNRSQQLRSAVTHTFNTVRSSAGGCFRPFCSSFCIRLTSVEWWRVMALSYISMRMTVKSISARQSTMRRLRLTVFPAVSMMSRPGSAQADCDWTLPRRKCCGWALNQQLKLSIEDVPILSASIRIVDKARDLWVVIDSGLTMSDHVTAVCRSAYYQLRQLRMVVRSLSDDAKKTLVQSFVSCRLDSLPISGGLIQRLQSV